MEAQRAGTLGSKTRGSEDHGDFETFLAEQREHLRRQQQFLSEKLKLEEEAEVAELQDRPKINANSKTLLQRKSPGESALYRLTQKATILNNPAKAPTSNPGMELVVCGLYLDRHSNHESPIELNNSSEKALLLRSFRKMPPKERLKGKLRWPQAPSILGPTIRACRVRPKMKTRFQTGSSGRFSKLLRKWESQARTHSHMPNFRRCC